MHLRLRPGVDGLAVNRELLLEYPQLFEPLRKLESDSVFVDAGVQLDLDFEPDGHICTPTGKILGPHQVAYPVRPARNPLENLQSKPNRCLARAVFAGRSAES